MESRGKIFTLDNIGAIIDWSDDLESSTGYLSTEAIKRSVQAYGLRHGYPVYLALYSKRGTSNFKFSSMLDFEANEYKVRTKMHKKSFKFISKEDYERSRIHRLHSE